MAGTLGALVATISIFLPSFLMTVVAGSSLARFHTNKIVQSFLKGVTPAVVGLLVAAGISIGRAGIHSWVGMLIALIAGVVLVRYRPKRDLGDPGRGRGAVRGWLLHSIKTRGQRSGRSTVKISRSEVRDRNKLWRGPEIESEVRG